MPTNNSVTQTLQRPLLTAAAIALFLGLISLALFAQQKPLPSQQKAPPSLPSFCSPAPSSTDPSVVAADAAALLPVTPLPPGVPYGPNEGIIGPLPGEMIRSPNLDEDKNLYGYSGPFYNTTNLDDQVVVLAPSLYTWPASTWKVTGLLRNQTRCPVHIAGLTARLLGPRGELFTTVTSAVSVADLRPGEPSPFFIEAPIAGARVKSIDWHIDYAPAEARPRLFEFARGHQEGGVRYYVDGTIRNAATTTARGVHVVVAWLNVYTNQVLYTAPAMLRTFENPKTQVETLDLAAGDTEEFVFVTFDPALVQLLGGKVVLWGVSQ